MNAKTLLARWLLCALLAAFAFLPARAAPPQTISYQGFLTTSAGAPVSATVSVQFSLYDTASGGTPLWTETQSVTAANGLYNVVLGNITPINLPFDAPYFLGVKVGTDAEMTPRAALTMVPYAFRALTADNVSSTATIQGSQITGTISGATVPGAAPWVTVAGATQQAASNTAYLVTGSTPTTITLPASPAVGDVIKVSSSGTGGFTLVPNVGQQIAGGTLYFAWSPRGAPRTSTDGVTYLMDTGNWTALASSADGTKLIAADSFCDKRLFTSADGGIAWTERRVPDPPPDPLGNPAIVCWTSVASSADGTKLVAVDNAWLTIYTSADSGATWVLRTFGAAGDNWQRVASSSDGTKLVATGSIGGVYRSTDSGATWTLSLPVQGMRAVASSADGMKLVAAVSSTTSGLGIYTSTDGGATWIPRGYAGRTWFSFASSADGTRLVGTDTTSGLGNLWISKDSGVTWTPRENARNWRYVASSADGMKLIAAATSGQLYTSTDGGDTWTARETMRNWRPVASSADGTKLVAAETSNPTSTTTTPLVSPPGYIYTASIDTTSISGGLNAAVELIFAGNGQWVIVNQQGTLRTP